MIHLPPPSKDALIHQQKLLRFLSTMCKNKGPLTFAEFMAMALYAPGLGYYSAGAQKFGADGDFVTAPEISPLFARCLARQCLQILTTLNNADACILELGAGSGKMAGDLLLALTAFGRLPKHYFILEVSADLRQRQQAYLEELLPDYIDNIIWLDKLPSIPFNGIILGNEVLDAMPVELFQIGDDNAILEATVNNENDKWQLDFKPAREPLREAVSALQKQLDFTFPKGYTSEINLGLAPWFEALSATLNQGVILLIDYGFANHEYYHPSRHMGTLMCHYRHHAHPDPLQFIGLQDITAHVDFTLLAHIATACDYQVRGYTNQAAFLLATGLLDEISEDTQEQLKLSQQIQVLTGAHEMGELFKVIALAKNYDEPLQGFALRDFRHRL